MDFSDAIFKIAYTKQISFCIKHCHMLLADMPVVIW